jgi:DNA-binding transcriptional ArsR family regulator
MNRPRVVHDAARAPVDPGSALDGRFDIANLAQLLSEPSRTAMLVALLDDRARPASELARLAGITPATASSHLGKLADEGLVVGEARGRYRFYRLRDESVGHALEALAGLRPVRPRPAQGDGDPARRAFLFARTCYRHLAGELGVHLTDVLEARRLTRSAGGRVTLTDRGRELLEREGLIATGARLEGKPCPDWTERRAHLAGPLGVALLAGMLEKRWLRAGREARTLRATPIGARRLATIFDVAVPPD